jgi:hypothetical protein
MVLEKGLIALCRLQAETTPKPTAIQRVVSYDLSVTCRLAIDGQNLGTLFSQAKRKHRDVKCSNQNARHRAANKNAKAAPPSQPREADSCRDHRTAMCRYDKIEEDPADNPCDRGMPADRDSAGQDCRHEDQPHAAEKQRNGAVDEQREGSNHSPRRSAAKRLAKHIGPRNSIVRVVVLRRVWPRGWFHRGSPSPVVVRRQTQSIAGEDPPPTAHFFYGTFCATTRLATILVAEMTNSSLGLAQPPLGAVRRQGGRDARAPAR